MLMATHTTLVIDAFHTAFVVLNETHGVVASVVFQTRVLTATRSAWFMAVSQRACCL